MAFKKLRITKGFDSQKILAMEIGVKRSTVSMWDIGKSIPKFAHLKKLSLIFNIPINDLFDLFNNKF